MSFSDAHQQHHKIEGMKAAALSPRTPAHLRQHIHRKIKEHEAMAPKHNQTTFSAIHGRGAATSPVKLAAKKASANPQPKKTAASAEYSGLHPARIAELQSTSNPSADAQKQIAAPPAPFKTKNSSGAAVASTPSTNQTGPDYKPTAGLSGMDDGGPIEGQAGPVASGPKAVPKAHAKSGAINQAKVSKPFGDHNQPKGRRGPRSAFFGE